MRPASDGKQSPSTMNKYAGKVAVITGASVGIGAAICDKLVEDGMIVVGLARRVERVQAHAKALQGKRGKLHAFKTDMTVESDILEAFKWTTDNLGPVHVLVNNAGVISNTSLVAGETAKWRTVFDTNVLGLCIATREAIKVMKRFDIEGHIVHVNSISGHNVVYVPGLNVYGASKFAVTNLTEMLRRELLDLNYKIKVSSVSPGIVETEFLDNVGVGSKEVKKIFEEAPKLQAEDVADCVIFILSTPKHVQIHDIVVKPTCDPY